VAPVPQITAPAISASSAPSLGTPVRAVPLSSGCGGCLPTAGSGGGPSSLPVSVVRWTGLGTHWISQASPPCERPASLCVNLAKSQIGCGFPGKTQLTRRRGSLGAPDI